MSDSTDSAPSIDDLNQQVHDLNYVESGRQSDTKITSDEAKTQELAGKIQKNIQEHQNEYNSQPRANFQAQ
jgi:hypothetical protein